MAPRICRFRPRRLFTSFVLISGVFTIFIIIIHPWLLIDLGYYLRPLWDTPDRPWTIIPHYYSINTSMEHLCKLHNWAYIRDAKKRPKVFDAIVFSNELDFLEIRLHELYDVVDKFIIVESNVTFSGKPKDLAFQDSKERFAFAESKIIHSVVKLGQIPPGKDSFYNENLSRGHINSLLSGSAGVEAGDLVIMSDLDELPSAHTIQLLKSCHGVPTSLHLQLKNYLYSFEFFYDWNNWQAHVETWKPGVSRYHHRRLKSDNILLADAGWHCSWCFRKIEDFIFKMKAYSHPERTRHSGLLSPQRIQNVICEGNEIFDMLPEAFTYREFIAKWGEIPRLSTAVNLPSYIVKNSDKFRYLLPGGCIR